MIEGKVVNKTQLASKLKISRSALYYKAKLPIKDELLRDQILKVLADNPSYGHRRIALALKVNKKRIRRVMKIYSIKPYKRKARWRKRRGERREESKYQNLIKGVVPNAPKQTYVSDFTYLRHKDKYIYLATYMDLFTREIVGWNISNKHTAELVTNAFLDSVENRNYVLPKVVHSDQGCEYTSKDYTSFVEKLGVKVSMSKKASPWENGYQESFYSNFKTDLGLEFYRFESIGELIEAIHKTIDYYNNRRIHSTLKMPPVKFRELWEQNNFHLLY